MPRRSAGLHCYFRVNACLGSMASPAGNPAAFSALPAASSAPFSHGNFASMPRVTGSPSGPPKSSGHTPFGTTSAEMPRSRMPFPSTASMPSGGTTRAVRGIGGVGKADQHRDHLPFTGTAPVIRLIWLKDTLRPAAL